MELKKDEEEGKREKEGENEGRKEGGGEEMWHLRNQRVPMNAFTRSSVPSLPPWLMGSFGPLVLWSSAPVMEGKVLDRRVN
jgi:hypothetical protein